MDYFSGNEKIKESTRVSGPFSKMRFLLFASFFLSFFILQSFFICASAQVISEQDSVNVNASVPGASPVDLGGGGGGGGAPIISDIVPPEIFDIKVDNINFNSARISWKTNEISVPQLSYGKTAAFEKTYIGESFTLENSIFLENLLPQTIYYFEIIATDRGGIRTFAKDLKFVTLGLPDNISPANVSRFRAVSGDSEINLSWKNPADPDFQGVKIYRSENFYPKDQKGGVLIYDGKESFFIDKDLVNGILYYYTAFAYDYSGNYSSGAVVKARPQKYVLPTPLPSQMPSPSLLPTASPPQISPVPSVIPSLKLDDFAFSQDGKDLKNTDGKIEVESGKDLTVSIDPKKVSEMIGTMMFILAQDGEPESFLFKKDIDKNEYSVSFAPPALGGVYSLTIAVLDKKNDPVQAISGNVIVSVAEKKPEKPFWYVDLLWLFLIIFIILLLRALWKIIRKAREENKRKKELKKN